MFENERIVCEFLRKVAPSREWEYLGEVEHYWIGELCDELNKQLKAENATLRQQLADVTESMGRVEERCAKLREYIERKQHLQDFARLVNENAKLRELVRALICATDPHDRERLIINAVELLGELGVEV